MRCRRSTRRTSPSPRATWASSWSRSPSSSRLLAEATWDRRLLKWAFAVVLAEGLILAVIGIGQFADRAHLLERQAGRLQRLPLLLPGQLALLGPQHLRPLPGARHPAWDDRARLGRQPAARARPRRRGGGRLRRAASSPSRRPASSPSSSAWRCWPRCAGASAGPRSRRRSPSPRSSLGVLFVAGGSNESTRTVTEGHSSLVSGGVKLARHRPLYGYGSASFSKAFARGRERGPGRHDDLAHRAGHRRGRAGGHRHRRLSGAAGGGPLDGLRRDAFDGTGFRSALPDAARRGTGSSSPRRGSGSPRPSRRCWSTRSATPPT